MQGMAGRADHHARRAHRRHAGPTGTTAIFKCGGFNAADRICVPDLDAKFASYLESIDPAERKKLAEEIQRAILENYYFVPVFRHAFVNAHRPADRGAEMAGRVSRPSPRGYAYPWEDIKLKD